MTHHAWRVAQQALHACAGNAGVIRAVSNVQHSRGAGFGVMHLPLKNTLPIRAEQELDINAGYRVLNIQEIVDRFGKRYRIDLVCLVIDGEDFSTYISEELLLSTLRVFGDLDTLRAACEEGLVKLQTFGGPRRKIRFVRMSEADCE